MDRFLAAVRHGEILGDKPTVQQIYEEGAASVSEADRDGMITLALAAHLGRSINDCYDDKVRTLWCSASRLYRFERSVSAMEISTFLKVITLICDAPAVVTAGFYTAGSNLMNLELPPQDAELVEEGRQLRARLPAYLEQQSASITTHCPLPAVLQKIVATYAEPTSADVWDSRLE
jgi:hypothetical protein